MEAANHTMRAALVTVYGEDPRVETVPVPRPGPGEALVRVRAAGLCATDLKVISGALSGSTGLPRIPGHEIAGTVVQCDSHPEMVGRNVAVYLYATCGSCEFCRSGKQTLCRQAVRPGIERDGGLAEYVCVDAGTLLGLDPETDLESAAVAMDAVLTPWGALVGKGQVTEGEDVLVVGCGGLGSNAVQIARARGARVAVVDPAEPHRETALSLGAEIAVDPADRERVCEWSRNGLGADLALDTSGRKEGFESAAACVSPGGRVVCNGYQPETGYGLESSRLVLDEIKIMGSRVASIEQAREALDAVEKGEVKPTIMRRLALEEIGTALDLLRSGKVNGRLVIHPGSDPASGEDTSKKGVNG